MIDNMDGFEEIMAQRKLEAERERQDALEEAAMCEECGSENLDDAETFEEDCANHDNRLLMSTVEQFEVVDILNQALGLSWADKDVYFNIPCAIQALVDQRDENDHELRLAWASLEVTEMERDAALARIRLLTMREGD